MSNRAPGSGWQGLATGLSLGLDLALPIFAGGFLGRYVDGRLRWHPWGTFVGIVAGMAVGGYLAYRVIRRALDRIS